MHVHTVHIRIAGNFRGVQFSRISGNPRKVDHKICTTVQRIIVMIVRLRKLNLENIKDWPSAKIGPHENFPLYGMLWAPLDS
jgi:hypothetical protein